VWGAMGDGEQYEGMGSTRSGGASCQRPLSGAVSPGRRVGGEDALDAVIKYTARKFVASSRANLSFRSLESIDVFDDFTMQTGVPLGRKGIAAVAMEIRPATRLVLCDEAKKRGEPWSSRLVTGRHL
jgi:hypothetical protein